jgi:hypothetical protein
LSLDALKLKYTARYGISLSAGNNPICFYYRKALLFFEGSADRGSAFEGRTGGQNFQCSHFIKIDVISQKLLVHSARAAFKNNIFRPYHQKKHSLTEILKKFKSLSVFLRITALIYTSKSRKAICLREIVFLKTGRKKPKRILEFPEEVPQQSGCRQLMSFLKSGTKIEPNI